MRFAIDAHAIGRHLTGNEVYVRSLLNAFAAQDRGLRIRGLRLFGRGTRASFPPRIRTPPCRRESVPAAGFDLAMRVRADRPDLLHVQYTAPMGCPVPVVVSVHDVSFLEHPEYFTRDRAWQLQWTVRRTVQRAAKILTGTRIFAQIDSQSLRRPGRGQSGGGAERRRVRNSARLRAKRPRPPCGERFRHPRRRSSSRWAICSRARTISG